MYDVLVKSLRQCAEASCAGCKNDLVQIGCRGLLQHEAADAIEQLSMRRHGDEAAISGMKLEIERMVVNAPRWIPVTERLPTVDEEVLVVAYGSMMRIWNIHRLDPETADVCWECEDGTLDDVCVVTHWMPLPQPPKEEA